MKKVTKRTLAGMLKDKQTTTLQEAEMQHTKGGSMGDGDCSDIKIYHGGGRTTSFCGEPGECWDCDSDM